MRLVKYLASLVGIIVIASVMGLVWLVFATSPPAPPASVPLSADAQGRPNILLLVAEDMGARLGAFGDDVARTPVLDRFAQTAVRYPNTFTAAGVCAPSRAALITGQYQFTIGAQHMRSSGMGYRAVPPAGVKAFPELLRQNGYYTFTDQKLDYQFSGPLAGSGPFTIWDDEGEGAHWRRRADGQPFFGLINFQVTHESGIFAPLGTWPRNIMHFVMQLVRHREFGKVPEITDPAEVALPPYYPDLPDMRADVAHHYDNIAFMDGQVGALLQQLEQDGLLDNTIVIWTTDHGDGLPRAKRELFDSGIKVPMMIRWPQSYTPSHNAGGSVDTRLISFVDLAPTILDLAQARHSQNLPGRNVLQDPPRDFVFAGRDRIDEQPDRQRAVRSADYKFIRSYAPDVAGGHALKFRDTQAGMRAMRSAFEAGQLNDVQARWFRPVGAQQLYRVSDDPDELHNLATDPAHQAVKQEMAAQLDHFLVHIGDTGAVAETDMIAAITGPDGKARITQTPTIAEADGLLHLSAADNASIGYRWAGGAWRVYNGPIAPQPAMLEVKAVRYGWDESETVMWGPQQ